MSDRQAKDAESFNQMLDQYEQDMRDIPARINACGSLAEAITIIKIWLCDDMDCDPVVAAWERKEESQLN